MTAAKVEGSSEWAEGGSSAQPAKPQVRNPAWTRDELILALAAYFRAGRRVRDPSSPEVVALSSVLNKLGIHDGIPRGTEFRNPNGVAMKLANFASIDPDKPGAGLSRGNKLEKVLWDEFAETTEELYRVAAAIQATVAANAVKEPIRSYDPDGVEEEFPEGRLLTRLHLARERNTKAVRAKKQAVLAEHGTLACECCGFNFEKVYGELGREFAECHHRTPLSDLREVGRTKLEDLAIVCANCHRMLHRSRPVLSVEQLRSILRNA